MNSNILIDKLKKRMREILETQLPPSALKEYNQLQQTIDTIQQVEENGRIIPSIPVRQAVTEYLRDNGPSNPSVIRDATGLHYASVSQCLSANKDVFVRLAPGQWGLKGIDEAEQENLNTVSSWKEGAEIPF